MSAPEPNLIPNTQVRFTIKAGGKPVADTISVVAIDTWLQVNKVPRARLVLVDGNVATQKFELSSSNTFVPGAKVEIFAGYADAKETRIFAGLVVKQSIEITREKASKLIVELSDEALRMTLDRKNAVFEKIKDSVLIGQLISRNKLNKKVANTAVTHPEIVQFYATDWDLMVMRAEANGMLVMVEAGMLHVASPDTAASPVLTVSFGISILDFYAEMDASQQYAKTAIKSSTWDSAQQKVLDGKSGPVTVKEAGNLSTDELAKVFGVKEYLQQTGASVEKASLPVWSSAELLKSKLAKIKGSVSFQGNGFAKPGTMITLAGVGERFNGNVFVSAVHHSITNGAWITYCDFGLSAQWYSSETPNVPAPGASGLLPPVKGLQTGIVKNIAKDPAGEFRVEIELPILQKPGKTVWARLASFYASNKVGNFFYPEIHDEVIVGFMNEDPRNPIILGSVYSKKHSPPFPPDPNNDKKAIVTRSNLQVSFDEKDKIIEISTPGENRIKLDDKSKKITISDGNKNQVTMSKSGITLSSGSNMTLQSKGNMTLQAGANLTMSAKTSASTEALQISHKAKGKFSAQASGMAEVKASGILTLRGTLVKIN